MERVAVVDFELAGVEGFDLGIERAHAGNPWKKTSSESSSRPRVRLPRSLVGGASAASSCAAGGGAKGLRLKPLPHGKSGYRSRPSVKRQRCSRSRAVVTTALLAVSNSARTRSDERRVGKEGV